MNLQGGCYQVTTSPYKDTPWYGGKTSRGVCLLRKAQHCCFALCVWRCSSAAAPVRLAAQCKLHALSYGLGLLSFRYTVRNPPMAFWFLYVFHKMFAALCSALARLAGTTHAPSCDPPSRWSVLTSKSLLGFELFRSTCPSLVFAPCPLSLLCCSFSRCQSRCPMQRSCMCST